MLKDRLLVGIIGAALAITIMLTGRIVLGVAVSVIALVALAEMYTALGGIKNNIALSVIGGVAGVLIVLLCNFNAGLSVIMGVIITYMIASMICMVLSHKEDEFAKVTTFYFSTIYVVFFISHLILIRNQENGQFLIWIPIIIAWLSDTMAYTFGLLFGKHKLIPAVSPKKTVEGAAGGVFGGVVFMMIYGAICAFGFNVAAAWWKLVALGVLGSVVSQFGDLAASWIKREKGIKDYGTLLPGHGGVLDRFDSVLFTAPFVYYFNLLFNIF